MNDLKKFKQFNLNNVGKEKGKKKLKHYLTQIDVLVSNGNEKNAFITGFLVDYDLNYENINELDKIYLKNVVRYRDIKDSDGERKLETVGSKTKVSISGDVFILDANKIINMNIIYVPKLVSFSKKPEMKILSNIYFFGSILNIVVFFLFVYSLFNNNFSLNLEIFDHSLNWFQKLFLAFTLIQFNSIWMPSIHGEHKNKYKYVRKDIFETFKALLFFSLITLLFIFYNDLWILIKSFFI